MNGWEILRLVLIGWFILALGVAVGWSIAASAMKRRGRRRG